MKTKTRKDQMHLRLKLSLIKENLWKLNNKPHVYLLSE